MAYADTDLGGVPHNPCRFKDTVGIVLEKQRPADVLGIFELS